MKEYEIVVLRSVDNINQLKEAKQTLNKLAEQGWQVTFVTQSAQSRIVYTLERFIEK